MTITSPREILDFWFKETKPEQRFEADPAFDAVVKARFEETWRAAREGQLKDWEASQNGTLALLILLDQFPRNMFRGQGESFATDALAREVANHAVGRGYDLEAPVPIRSFFLLAVHAFGKSCRSGTLGRAHQRTAGREPFLLSLCALPQRRDPAFRAVPGAQ